VWGVNGLLLLTGKPGSTSAALGWFLLALSAVMPGLAVPAFKGKPLFGVLFSAAVVRFAIAGLYQLTGNTTLNTVGGWISIAVAVFALYGGVALLIEDVRQRTILPLGRRGEAREWLEDERSLANQLSRVGREAGVRHQL
jgi:succinate-acetate transporter protein